MRKWTAFAAITAVAALLCASAALADGTETLGPPSVGIATGTEIIRRGTGMQAFPNLPNSFSVTVPGNVKQVLLYWEGHWSAGGNNLYGAGRRRQHDQRQRQLRHRDEDRRAHDVLPPEPGSVRRHGAENYATYRADITGLHLVNSGPNTLTVNDMLFASNLPSGNPFTRGTTVRA